LALVSTGLPASAGHKTDPHTKNLHPLGHIEEPRSLINPAVGNTNIHTDIAFWGNLAFQGNWDGFTIRDISAPGNPKTVSHTSCDGNQGDIVVWDDILVRSWNAPAGASPLPFGTGTTCDGEDVPPGWEGVHVFDISDLENPELVGSVQLQCGSHTASGVPDVENNRLIVYSSPSAHSATNPNPPATCDWFDVIEVPLDDPAGAFLVREVDAMHTCHDIGVILGDAMKAACAGGEGVRVFGIGGDSGGSLDDPQLLFHVEEPGVAIGHSAAWTWDGEVIIFGHEPGGGVQARCKETDSVVDRSLFFYDGADGTKLGQWTLTRFQSGNENCTLHNYNVVPLRSGKYVLVHGSYQSGTAVLDCTDPANAVEIAWSDPPPLPVPPGTPFCLVDGDGCELGGAWASYWYNGFIYETNITEGLNIFLLSGRERAGDIRLDHLNPQTQEFTLP
jgi:hypothetical protein